MIDAAPAFSAGLSRAASDSDFSTTREIRNLANLNRTWSSCRVLNLARIYATYKDSRDYIDKPLFENSALNRCLILKHTLRLDERDLFPSGRRTVTKIILPYDLNDFRLGGRSFFYRQTQFETLMRSYLGIEDLSKNRDARVLKCIDDLPSLDPFLLRENLDKAGFKPSGVYFQISPHDLKAMTAFTAREIENLVNVALNSGKGAGKGEARTGSASKLGAKILSDKLSVTLAPLQMTLRMSDEEFQEGIMCWRGFLYYKWCHLELQQGLRDVLGGLGSYRPSGGHDDSLRIYLKKARPRIAKAIVDVIKDAKDTLDHYDQVYHALAVRRDPEPFRQFLLFGSELFLELGQKIGTLNHITSFWRYRMARINRKGAQPMQDIEFADILLDFEAGLFNSLKKDEMRFRA